MCCHITCFRAQEDQLSKLVSRKAKKKMWLGKASLNISSNDQHHAKKDEIAVHCCDPALAVLVMLVSRNVFHVSLVPEGPVHSSAYKWELDSLRTCESWINHLYWPIRTVHKREWRVITDPISILFPKVIHLELFLDVVSLNSFTDVTIRIALTFL